MRIDRSKPYRLAAMAAVAASLAGLAPVSWAALAHRYSFDDGTANDNVATANGILINGATITSGSAGTAPAAGLPAGATSGISGSFTVEQIFTESASDTGSFPTLFSFATDTNNYLLVNSHRGALGGNLSVDYKEAGVNGGAEPYSRPPARSPRAPPSTC